MARRRRKRRGADFRAPGRRQRSERAETVSARARRAGERPPAPWGSFPLVELAILLALILVVAGLLVGSERGKTMIAAGLALGVLGGTEVSIREHLAGYRSHTTLLSGLVTALIVTVVFIALPHGFVVGVGLALATVTFVVSFYLFREAFKRRSGGLGFKA